jgi:late competence protein required for DNA uptake (superfamily II DNA/RNA helicase)
MKWSTNKFAEDVLWACKVWRVPVRKAVEIIEPNTCPIKKIMKYRCIRCMENLTCSECRYDIDIMYGPHCTDMGALWSEVKLNACRIYKLKQWLKANGYL